MTYAPQEKHYTSLFGRYRQEGYVTDLEQNVYSFLKR